jgi:hypothetical protein
MKSPTSVTLPLQGVSPPHGVSWDFLFREQEKRPWLMVVAVIGSLLLHAVGALLASSLRSPPAADRPFPWSPLFVVVESATRQPPAEESSSVPRREDGNARTKQKTTKATSLAHDLPASEIAGHEDDPKNFVREPNEAEQADRMVTDRNDAPQDLVRAHRGGQPEDVSPEESRAPLDLFDIRIPRIASEPRHGTPILEPANAFPVEVNDRRDAELARGIAKATVADCRSAHAGLGLLAIPLLMRDTVTGAGCRW